MTDVFPVGFPGPTIFYLALYIVTLLIHVLFMAYVLAGSLVLAGRAAVGWVSRQHLEANLLETVLRDWLPFFLGAAITAGVAPLLFLQVLYKEHFYTANLLLVHRWMALLPALIVAFYLLYLMKTAWFRRAAPGLRLALSVAAWGLFLFVAWSWTENHLLSLRGQSTWVPFYAARRIFFADPALWPRLGIWVGGAVPVMATIVATQIAWLRQARLSHPAIAHSEGQDMALADNLHFECGRLPILALGGLVVAGICAFGYPLQTDFASPWASLGNPLSNPMSRAYVIAGIVGVVLQTLGWLSMRQTRRVSGGVLSLLWSGLLLTMVGVAVVRESMRLASLDVRQLYAQHARAAGMGGIGVFVIFALINGLLVGWCLRTCARSTSAAALDGLPNERKVGSGVTNDP